MVGARWQREDPREVLLIIDYEDQSGLRESTRLLLLLLLLRAAGALRRVWRAGRSAWSPPARS